jgi:hypothetical protein
MAIASLVSSTNHEGYDFALEKISEFFTIPAPAKSALSKYRQKISFIFFENIFKSMIDNFKPEMRRYKGYHVVGIDGDDLNLPPNEEILKKGYRGYPLPFNQETYMLKMYLVKCVDLLSGAVINFKQSAFNDEIGGAIEMLSELPKGTIAIFDRLYLSARLIEEFAKVGQIYFIARCKGGSTFKEVVSFFKSKKRRSFYYYLDESTGIIIKINLIKVKNPQGKGSIVIATNLDITEWTNEEIANLYTLRWDCETSNRDSTSTIKMDQWHSIFYNGIMQEIYAHYILINITKITIFQGEGYLIDLEKNVTRKTNFKFIFYAIFKRLHLLFKNAWEEALVSIKASIKRKMEKRNRLSRKYPREVKRKGKSYKNAAVIKRRPTFKTK